MARKVRSRKVRKKTARKAAAATGVKTAARKRADRKRKAAARGKTAAPRRRDVQPPIISGRITTALQAVVDAIAGSDLLHGRTPPRLRPASE